jgi:hypothetical protein
MGLFKSSASGRTKSGDSGLSLLQGLGILAILGIAAAIVLNYLV